MSEPGAGEPTFEEALAALEAVVGRLESGEVGLEEAVALFEEGQRHLAVCRRRLEAVRGRIEELTAEELLGRAEAGAAEPEAAEGEPF